jgi:hypothetical protein
MTFFYVVGIPLAAAVVAGIPLSLFSAPWLVRVSNWSIGTQIGLVLTTWLMFSLLDGKRNWSGSVGDTCPDLGGAYGSAILVFALGSIGVGGVALASSVLSTSRSAAGPGRVVAGLAAAALYVAIWIPLIIAAFCGWN